MSLHQIFVQGCLAQQLKYHTGVQGLFGVDELPVPAEEAEVQGAASAEDQGAAAAEDQGTAAAEVQGAAAAEDQGPGAAAFDWFPSVNFNPMMNSWNTSNNT
ncbi:hypothetical protein ABVT39_028117 [Epinephelus coioides]